MACRVTPPHGGQQHLGDVGDGTGLQIYRAVEEACWVLANDGRPDHRVPASLG